MIREPHHLRTVLFDVCTTGSVEDGRTAQDLIAERWAPGLPGILEEAFDSLDVGDGVVRIDRFEIDLGSLTNFDDFDTLRRRLARMLPRALMEAIGSRELAVHRSDVQVVDSVTRRRELVRRVLSSGTLPWWSLPLSLEKLREEIRLWAMSADISEMRWLDAQLESRDEIARRLERQLDSECCEIVLRRLAELLPSPRSFLGRFLVHTQKESAALTPFLETTPGADTRRAVLAWTRERIRDGSFFRGPRRVLEQLLREFAPVDSIDDVGELRRVLAVHFEMDAPNVTAVLDELGLRDKERRTPSERQSGGETGETATDDSSTPSEPASRREEPATMDDVLHQVEPDRTVERPPKQHLETPTSRKSRRRRAGMEGSAAGSDALGSSLGETEPDFDTDFAEPLAPGEDDEGTYVRSAGIVLLRPFIARFFEQTKLTEQDRFGDEAARHRGVLLLHTLATGECSGAEVDLVLQKILCGVSWDDPVESEWTLMAEEQTECDDLLQSAIEHWSILGATSVAAFRETFLERPGHIARTPVGFLLRVERRGVDVLVDQLPWVFTPVSYPWMNQPLHVEW